MSRQRLAQQIISVGVVLLFLIGCGASTSPTPIPSTATPVPPTATPTPVSPTTTPTPVPPTATATPIAECASSDQPVKLGLSLEEFDNSVISSPVSISIFQDGKEVAFGKTTNGLFVVSLNPGLYTILVEYGEPRQKYLKTVCLREEGSLVSILLPYSNLEVLVRTEDNLAPFQTNLKLKILTPQMKSTNTQLPISRFDIRQSVYKLKILEGSYYLALTYQDANFQTQTDERMITLQAGQPFTETFSSLPKDGQLEFNIIRTTSAGGGGQQQVVRTKIANDSGAVIFENIRYNASLPLPVGNYKALISYHVGTTVTHKIEIPVEIRSGKITSVQASDDFSSPPTIEFRERNVVSSGF